jgi:hypothetical protein
MRITSSGELQVTGNGVIKNQESGGNYSYWQQTSSDARLAVQYSQPLLFLTNATERMRITSGGLVGIGNTIPASYNADANDLVVGTTSGNNGITVVSGSNANGGLYFADGITGSEQYRGYIDYGHTTDYLAFGTAGVEKVRITSAGNVGIGTTSPNIGTWNQALTLNTASGNAAYELAVAGSAQLYLAADNSNAYLQVANATSPLRVFTGGSERMRITSGGNLLIGTTTDLGNNLQVLGSGLFYTNSTTGSTALLTLSRNVTGYGQTTFQQSYHSTFYTNGKTLTLKNDSNTEFAHFAGNNAGTITDLIIPTGSIKTAAPSGGSAQTWKLGEGNVTIGGSDGKAVKVEIDGTLYYLMTGYLPEPEPEAMSGPSMGYKAKFEEPVIKIKSDNQKIKDLEKEIAELKAMMKVLIEKK